MESNKKNDIVDALLNIKTVKWGEQKPEDLDNSGIPRFNIDGYTKGSYTFKNYYVFELPEMVTIKPKDGSVGEFEKQTNTGHAMAISRELVSKLQQLSDVIDVEKKQNPKSSL